MNLELGKTYRCRNGTKVTIIRGERTMSGQIDRFWGETADPYPNKMLFAYYPNGRPEVSSYAGYTIEAEVRTDQQTRAHPTPVAYTEHEGGAWLAWDKTGRSSLIHAIKFEDCAIFDAVNGWRKSTLPLNNPEKETNPMCGPGTGPDSKAIAEQAARELADLLNIELSISINPILLRLWLVDRWDRVAKLAHKIHNAV